MGCLFHIYITQRSSQVEVFLPAMEELDRWELTLQLSFYLRMAQLSSCSGHYFLQRPSSWQLVKLYFATLQLESGPFMHTTCIFYAIIIQAMASEKLTI